MSDRVHGARLKILTENEKFVAKGGASSDEDEDIGSDDGDEDFEDEDDDGEYSKLKKNVNAFKNG